MNTSHNFDLSCQKHKYKQVDLARAWDCRPWLEILDTKFRANGEVPTDRQTAPKMSAGWDEIQKLAADLQRAQLGSSQQRLSERNCIEIVNKLVEMGLLADIIYTSDGKEYITSKHLQRLGWRQRSLQSIISNETRCMIL